jgi:sigma-B regulation protein RsbU (phosphoserine phosphatase)
MIFYSDGLVEAHNAEREMFGSQRLKKLFADFSGQEGTLIDYLMKALQDFIGEDQEQEDDITIVGINRYNNPVVN